MVSKKIQRKVLSGQKIRAIFAVYILFTMALLIILNIAVFSNIFLNMFSPSLVSGINSFNPVVWFLMMLVWVGYSFFFAYHYAVSKIQGMVTRMGKTFSRIAEGEIQRLSFRKNDPFHDVAANFNHMIKHMAHKRDLAEKLHKVVNLSQSEMKNQIKSLISELEH